MSLCLVGLLPLCAGGRPTHPDHHEFEAAIAAPFKGKGDARPVELMFEFPDAEDPTFGAWRVELVSPRGEVLRAWHGETLLTRGTGRTQLAWDGRDEQGRALPAGFYQLRLSAASLSLAEFKAAPGGTARIRVESHLAEGLEAFQEISIQVGEPAKPKVRPFVPMPRVGESRMEALRVGAAVAAPASLPYTVLFGNFHSQTNHSDGGAVVASCGGAETPQAGTQGPADAYEMVRVQAGGDFLLASEHNHMYDGSTGTNSGADPATAKGLFASGLTLASNYRTAHPEFMALYGLEWGVISGGGHLNLLNPDGLATWESNGAGQLLGDYFTAKSDYPSLYTFMKSRGWVGQFNHPQSSQFGGLAFTADGDEVMALCEVMNTSAFSKNLTESETSRSFYESTYNKLLEAGFHLAPTTDQDNHCANWGLSYTNRTGVLIPTGTALTHTAFMDAVKARRVFATMDKGSQIVLTTASGAVMGSRITNAGALTLQVRYATTTPGRSAARIQILEGVPGRRGTVTQLQEGSDTATFTPAAGSHFYYAIITQDNGDKLWSAPIWVEQSAGAVTANITAPAASMTVATGTNVSFAATATTTHASITDQVWNFGDGGTATGATANHTFTNGGASPVSYTVNFTATDDQGSTGTATRIITVNPAAASNTAPTLTAIPAQTTTVNTPITGIAFTVGDAESAAGSLDVTAVTTSNPTLVPSANLVLSGSGASRTLDITPAADQSGSATVRVTVTDPQGLSATRDIAVTVGAVTGQAKLIISQYYEGVSNNKWIEITNVGTAAYDAATSPQYLGSWFNPFTGGTTYTSLLIPGTIAVGETKLIKNNSAALPLAANVTGTATGTTSSALTFNGNDITYITPVSAAGAAAYAARTDAIGEQSSTWEASPNGFGKDTSFYRKFAVITPTATYTASQWTQATLATVDGGGGGATAPGRLGVHAFNRLPSVSDIPSQTTTTNTPVGPVAFTVGDTEAPLNVSLAVTSSNPALLPVANVVLGGSGTSRTLTLTPVADQSGTSLVTITVTDADGASTSDNFLLTVNVPNQAPVVVNQNLQTPEESALPVQLIATDPEGSPLTFTVLAGPAHGTLSGTAPDLVYTPAANYSGPDSFTYKANDGALDSATGTISLTVTPVNDGPAAANLTATTQEDTPRALVLEGTDLDGDALTYTILAGPTHGTLSGTAPNLVYTPVADYHGPDSFTYKVNDGTADSAAATVSLTVSAVDDAPRAVPESYSLRQDTSVRVTLQGRDTEGSPLTFIVATLPAFGTLSGTAPNLVYTPNANFKGHDSFLYKVNDGALDSAPARVDLDTDPVNHAPTAEAQTVNGLEGQPAALTLRGSDPERDHLSFRIATQPAHGTLSGVAPNLVYTPAPGFNGGDSFTFKAFDGEFESAPARVSLQVASVVDVPVAGAQSLGLLQGSPVTATFKVLSSEGVLTYSLVSAPAKGTVVLGNGTFTYTPHGGALGADAFQWRVTNVDGRSSTATVALRINALDLSADGSLDAGDLGALADALGSSDIAFDLNGDGRVDDADLLLFLAAIQR